MLTARGMIDEAETKGLVKGEAIGLEKGRAESEAERSKLKAELEMMSARIAELERLQSAKS